MHLFQPEVGMMGTSGIVGPCILQAAGAGYSARLLERDNVGVAFFGDGRGEQWRLPRRTEHGGDLEASGALYLREQPVRHRRVPFRYAAGNPSVATRGASYGIPGIEVDGNDVLAVWRAAGDAAERARSGGGPTLFGMQDLSHACPRRRDGRFWLSHARRGRCLEDALPQSPRCAAG